MRKITFVVTTTETIQADDDLTMDELGEMITGLDYDRDHPKFSSFDIVDTHHAGLRVEDSR